MDEMKWENGQSYALEIALATADGDCNAIKIFKAIGISYKMFYMAML